MKNLYAFVILAACALPARAETAAADTVATELKEVVVKSERAWVEGDKIVFIPNKREKNLSNSPASLVQKMNIPTVLVDDGSDVIKSTTGKVVVVFINGKRAQDTDLATFWPKQAKRVEYMENPTDPRYEGCAAVVNFVMTEYEVGGVTRFEAMQRIPNNGSYSAATKVEHHKMSYGIMFDGGYSRDHSMSYQGEDNYNGIYYKGLQYDNVRREYEGHSWSRSDDIDAGLNARYVSDKITATHTLGFRWNRNPGSGSYDAESWKPELFNSASAWSQSSGRSASPQLSGRYRFELNPKWTVVALWNYGYSHNDSRSMSQNGDLAPIYNAMEEDVHTAGLLLAPTFKPNEKYIAQIYLSSDMNWFSTRYAGSADRTVDQWRGETSATLRFAWIPSDNFWVDLKPGITSTYWKVSDLDRYSKAEPKGELGLFWRISRKLRLSASMYYFSKTPSASQSGDVMVRQSELMWLQGNPTLHNETSWSPRVHLVWLPVGWLNTTLICWYSRSNNELVNQYAVASAEQGGVINMYTNGAPEDNFSVIGNINMNFLGSNLRVRLQPQYTYTRTHGLYADKLGWFKYRASVGYDLQHCGFTVGNQSSQKALQSCGIVREWIPEEWYVSFTYGTGDFYLSAAVYDIFHSKRKSWTELNGSVYSSIRHNFSTGRCLRVSLSYTFGYGKQVEKSIDIDSPQELESGALGS